MVVRKKNNTKVLACAVLLIAIGSYAFLQFAANGFGTPMGTHANFEETPIRFVYAYDSAASFHAAADGSFFICTKDSVRHIDAQGNVQWEDVFTMVSPVMKRAGAFAIAGEHRGDSVFVYSTEGRRLYTARFDGNDVMYFTINASGDAAVIIRADQTYETHIFNADGRRLKVFMHEEHNIFPVAAAISDDSRIVSIGLLDISGARMRSHIFSAYLSRHESADFTDGIFNSVSKDRQFLAALHFTRGNNLFGFSDETVTRIALGQADGAVPTETINLTNRIDYLAFFADNGFVMALGDPLTDRNGLRRAHLEFYNAEGGLLETFEMDRRVTSVSVTGQHVVVAAGRTLYAFNSRGQLLWHTNATQDFRQVILLDSSGDTILFAGQTEAVIKRRVR